MRAKPVSAAQTYPSRYPVAVGKPGSDGAVIRGRLAQNLAVEDADAAAHEDVVDLTVWPRRGVGAPAYRPLPAAHQHADGRAPEVEITGKDLRPTIGKQAAQRHEVAHRRELSFTARVGTLLVGSVRLSPIRVGETSALLLGPLTVEPPFRDRGIGYALIERALSEAKDRGYRLILLVGDEPYYGKVGFKRIPKGSITMPGPVDPARLLVCELDEGASQGLSGQVQPDWSAA